MLNLLYINIIIHYIKISMKYISLDQKILILLFICILQNLAVAEPNLPHITEVYNKDNTWSFNKNKPQQIPDDISFFDQNLEKHYLEDYEGKTLLLVFWASWSASCTNQMMDLDILQKDFRKLPFEVLAISEDYQDIKVVEKFYELYNIRHLTLLHDYRNQLFKAFGVIGMPTSFLINADGMSVGSFTGITPWHNEQVRNIILSYIPGNPPEQKNSYKGQSLNQLFPTSKEQEKKRDDQDQKNSK